MSWLEPALDRLSQTPVVGYAPGQEAASEPTAVAALALWSHGRREAALEACHWLVARQAPDGAVGISASQAQPYWPTSLAILAWEAGLARADDQAAAERLRGAIELAVAKMQTLRGKPLEQTEQMGHDMSLVAWPWVDGTHSWSEPTAWQVLALKRWGQGQSPRCREAVRLLLNRLLPSGGSNYGNTVVLGQQLRPHLQPTGVVLAALAGEADEGGKLRGSVEFLSNQLGPETPTASLAYGVLGLTAQGARPAAAADWLAAAASRPGGFSTRPWQQALLVWGAAEEPAGIIPPVGGSTSRGAS